MNIIKNNDFLKPLEKWFSFFNNTPGLSLEIRLFIVVLS